MTRVLTLRVPPHLLAKADARAARLGLGRARYVRDLIEQDVADGPGTGPSHRFASEDLVGKYTTGLGSATNSRVREVMRQRLRARREKNR